MSQAIPPLQPTPPTIVTTQYLHVTQILAPIFKSFKPPILSSNYSFSGVNSMAKKEFKYYPEDFPPLKAKPTHMNLTFDIFNGYVDVQNHMTLRIDQPLSKISLDANNLEIRDVKCLESEITYAYDQPNSKLEITFKNKLKEGEIINIFTHTICKPTKNILEGIYFDQTPENAPPTMISQCQQWGFQRITPCFDDMQAKCTYNTKIIADSRYTHLISNGDILKPKTELGNGRSEIIYINSRTPMAPYLFFIGAGTYEQYERVFEYPDGTQFVLQLLAPIGSDKKAAEQALEILHDSIMWIHIFTGEKSYKDLELRQELYTLIQKRENMRARNDSPVEIRKEVAEFASQLNLGYQYTGSVYREIAMQNSNFGGMENVGNTTVVANRIMPFPKMPDSVFEYLIAVKCHEFYHNLNGSEVTGASPFEIWLNEAVTCVIEHDYMNYISQSQYSRLGEVMRIISPDGGTLDYDTGSMVMPVIPKGFNMPDDLISEVTYSKAPEFVRMVRSVMGTDTFAKALARYHSKFSHSNASTQDWIDCMNEISSIDFNPMALSWLHQTGYPTVHVKKEFKNNKLTLKLKQSGFEKAHWHFPFSATLVDEKGNDIVHAKIFMQDVEAEIVFENIKKEPAFISFARNYLFYGKVDYAYTNEELYLILKHDSDYINRYMAFTKIAEKEKMKMLENEKEAPSEKFIDTYFQLLSDEKLTRKMGVAILAIPESVEDKHKKHQYQKLYEISKKITHTIASKYKKELLKIYQSHKEKAIDAPFVQNKLHEIKMRSVKNTALSILSELDTGDIHKLILEQFNNPSAASDKYSAFAMILDSSIKEKEKIIESYEKEASMNLAEWEVFLSRIGGNDSKNPISLIQNVEKSKNFRIEQSNDQRMFMRFAYNKRISLLTEPGRKYLKDIMVRLAKLNEYSTMHILSVFSKINDFEPKYQEPMISLLKEIYDSLDEKAHSATCNTIRRLIKGAPQAIKSYEEKNSKLDAKYL